MKIGAILPTINLWGGVKRFLELGNRFIDAGHSYTVFTPEGVPPSWFIFKGAIAKIDSVEKKDLDVLFITETEFLKTLVNSSARLKVFYHVGIGEDLRPVLNIPEIKIFANSSFVYEFDKRRYKIFPIPMFGGVALPPVPIASQEKNDTFTILIYGRGLIRKRTGTRIIIKACERFFRKHTDVSILLYDTPHSSKDAEIIKNFKCKVPFKFIVNHPVDKNHELFRMASIYISAEKSGGWSNCSAEAMAAGIPVIGTKAGTRDFLFNKETGLLVYRNSFAITRAINKLYKDKILRDKLAKNGYDIIQQFEWGVLANKILTYLTNQLR